MSNKFTETEKEILLKFLDEYGDVLGDNGCNDFTLPNSPENKKLLKEVSLYNFGGKLNNKDYIEDVDRIDKNNTDKLYSADFIVLGYLRDKLKKVL